MKMLSLKNRSSLVVALVGFIFQAVSLQATINVVSYWRLGEADPGAAAGVTATNATDSVGAKNLKFQGNAKYTSDVGASAAAHTGSSLSVNFTNSAYATNAIVSTATDNFGIECWVKPTALGGGQVIAYNGGTGGVGSGGWGIVIGSDNTYDGLFGGVVGFGTTPVTANVWTHLALVRASGTSTLYINGVAAATATTGPALPQGNFALGAPPQAPTSQFFTGLIDEVRVFTFAAGQFSTNDLLLNCFRPVVITTGPTMQITNTATLNGTVNPGGLATVAWFEWGTAANNYTRQTAPVATGGGTVAVALSDTLSGLTPGIIYHCRAVGSNAAGVVRGKDVLFGSPAIVLNGEALLTNECHFGFSGPGATAFDAPLAIAAGGFDSLALRSDGTVAAWGDNFYGQVNVPVGLSNVVAIGAGDFHSLALRSDGIVVAWGSNFGYGQTNVPAGLNNVVAIAAGQNHSLALRSDGTVVAWGDNDYGQTTVPAGLSNVVAVAAGQDHSLALRSDGTVATWGDNGFAPMAVPAGLSNVVAIAAGEDHSLALRSDGTVAVWGANFSGQTNVPVGLSNVMAIAGNGEANHILALRSDGTVIAWGDNVHGQSTVPAGLSNVVGIAEGAYHSLALRSDGTIAAWGYNFYGQTTPIPVGLSSLALTVSGSVNTNLPGSYLLRCTSTNILGGVGQATRTVIVTDTLGPVITLLGNNPILITNVSNLPLVDPGATAFDLCEGASYSVTASNAVNVNFPGTYAITYRSTDSKGNIALATRTVIVALPPAVPGDQNGDGLVSQSELDAVYARYVTNSPWLCLTNVVGLGGTNVTFALSNSISGGYSVEVSTNLTDWQFLGPATPRYLFTDTNSPAPQRYYRLRYP